MNKRRTDIYLLAEFRDQAAAARAIRLLRETGVPVEHLDLFSEEPVEFPRGVLDRPSRMSLASVLGAIAFGLLATGFIFGAQHNYRLATGGMPIFSFWATGVITYEMTMLGAVVTTFGWFLWESGLLRKRDTSAPVPGVDPGSMCLRLRCSAEESALALKLMQGAGAVDIKRSPQ
jgi:hypothetical protein